MTLSNLKKRTDNLESNGGLEERAQECRQIAAWYLGLPQNRNHRYQGKIDELTNLLLKNGFSVGQFLAEIDGATRGKLPQVSITNAVKFD